MSLNCDMAASRVYALILSAVGGISFLRRPLITLQHKVCAQGSLDFPAGPLSFAHE